MRREQALLTAYDMKSMAISKRVALGLLILAPGLGGLVACAENKGASSSSTWSPGQDAYTSSTRATRLADEFHIDCPAGGCAPQVGALFISTWSSASTCTAFSVGEYEGKTAILTNKHCVERVTDCAEEVAFRLPSTGERARCDRILAVSSHALLQANGNVASVPDYAAVLLDRKLSTTPLSLSQAGIAPLTPVKVVVMQPQGSRSMRMEERPCSTGAAGLLTPSYTDAGQPNVSLFQCSIVGGNSGAPVLNGVGRVVAIVQIGMRQGAGALVAEGFDASEFRISEFGIATNLACVDAPAIGLRPIGACEVRAPRDLRNIQTDRVQEALTEPAFLLPLIESTDRFMREDSGRFFGWTVRNDDGRRVTSTAATRPLLSFELAPKCVLRASDPESQLRSRYFTEPGLVGRGRWSTTGSLASILPGGHVTGRFDQYGRMGLQMRLGFKRSTFEFNPSRIAEMRDDETVEVRERVGGSTLTHSLSLCPLGHYSNDLRDNQELLAIMRTGNRDAFRAYMQSRGASERPRR